VLLVGIRFFYSKNEGSQAVPVLRSLPVFSVQRIDESMISSSEFLSNSQFVVHIWGTWCAPCITEMPVLLDTARLPSNSQTKYYLIAVNDELKLIRKFIAKYSLPSNVEVLFDVNNVVMDKFGTFKVPESFIFKAGINKAKLVGPQDWDKVNLNSLYFN